MTNQMSLRTALDKLQWLRENLRPWAEGKMTRASVFPAAVAARQVEDAIAALAAPPHPVDAERVEHIQHVKSGGWYEVVTRDAQVQTDTPLADYAFVAVYRNVITGATWVRPLSEMDDGRFKAAPAALTPKPTGTEASRGVLSPDSQRAHEQMALEIEHHANAFGEPRARRDRLLMAAHLIRQIAATPTPPTPDSTAQGDGTSQEGGR